MHLGHNLDTQSTPEPCRAGSMGRGTYLKYVLSIKYFQYCKTERKWKKEELTTNNCVYNVFDSIHVIDLDERESNPSCWLMSQGPPGCASSRLVSTRSQLCQAFPSDTPWGRKTMPVITLSCHADECLGMTCQCAMLVLFSMGIPLQSRTPYFGWGSLLRCNSLAVCQLHIYVDLHHNVYNPAVSLEWHLLDWYIIHTHGEEMHGSIMQSVPNKKHRIIDGSIVVPRSPIRKASCT